MQFSKIKRTMSAIKNVFVIIIINWSSVNLFIACVPPCINKEPPNSAIY